ncbi:MAG: LEPR-XLL domain-containing protein, partial [Marinagarivorans sp.]
MKRVPTSGRSNKTRQSDKHPGKPAIQQESPTKEIWLLEALEPKVLLSADLIPSANNLNEPEPQYAVAELVVESSNYAVNPENQGSGWVSVPSLSSVNPVFTPDNSVIPLEAVNIDAGQRVSAHLDAMQTSTSFTFTLERETKVACDQLVALEASGLYWTILSADGKPLGAGNTGSDDVAPTPLQLPPGVYTLKFEVKDNSAFELGFHLAKAELSVQPESSAPLAVAVSPFTATPLPDEMAPLAADALPFPTQSHSLQTLAAPLALVQPTVTWIGTQGGSWNLATNWSTGAVPTGSDNVSINLSNGQSVTLNGGSFSVNSLVCNGELKLTNSATLELADESEIIGNLVLAGGTLDGTGTVTVLGAFDVTGSSTLSGTGTLITQGISQIGSAVNGGYLAFQRGWTWINEGTM